MSSRRGRVANAGATAPLSHGIVLVLARLLSGGVSPRGAAAASWVAAGPRRSSAGPAGTTARKATAVPSWEDLSAATGCDRRGPPPIAVDGASVSSDPDPSGGRRPTLYRERHGWCPYSERVWLALEAKGIDYDTVYIDNIYGRPR